MRRLGLLGIYDPKVTASYCRAITQSVAERTDGSLASDAAIENLWASEAGCKVDDGTSEALGAHLLKGLERLVVAGCEAAALVDCDAHAFHPWLAERSPIPLVSMVDAVQDELLRRSYKRVMLLGTVPAMRDTFFKGQLAKAGLLVLAPGGALRTWIGAVIIDELARGAVQEETVSRFARLVEDGAEHGVDAIIVGCPELQLLVDRLELGIPIVDVLGVHVRALVDVMLGEDLS